MTFQANKINVAQNMSLRKGMGYWLCMVLLTPIALLGFGAIALTLIDSPFEVWWSYLVIIPLTWGAYLWLQLLSYRASITDEQLEINSFFWRRSVRWRDVDKLESVISLYNTLIPLLGTRPSMYVGLKNKGWFFVPAEFFDNSKEFIVSAVQLAKTSNPAIRLSRPLLQGYETQNSQTQSSPSRTLSGSSKNHFRVIPFSIILLALIVLKILSFILKLP